MALFLVLAFLGILLVVASFHFGKKRQLKDKTVTAEEALTAWKSSELFIDVRTPEEYAAGHVPGAVLIPLKEIVARMNEIPKERKVLLICRSGNRSAQATLALIKYQYSNVYNVSGGMLQWKGPTQI